MTPSHADPGRRRVALYFFLILTLILAPLFFSFWLKKESGASADDFAHWMSVGKNYYDKNEAAKAIEPFQKAVQLQPTHLDALLNLANANLLASQPEAALASAREALNLDHNSATAHYLAGSACLRLRRFDEAIQHLQQAKDLDRKVNAVSFQLGRAFQETGRHQEAAAQFEEILQFDPDYPSANYLLAQSLLRLGRTEEANQALQSHQQLQARKPASSTDLAVFERCVYTEARVPFQLEQPAPDGIKVTFSDATATAFGADAGKFHGPIGIIDINHRGANDIFVGDGDGNFRLLLNTNGTFHPRDEVIAGQPGASFTRCLVGDINNDRHEDVVAISDQGLRLFKFATNGSISDLTRFSRLDNLPASDGALADLDFVGKLDLILIAPDTGAIRVMRNIGSSGGSPYFKDVTLTSGVPASVTGVTSIAVEDWNNDDVNDLLLARATQSPVILTKLRGGPFAETNPPANWPVGRQLIAGDFNNDLRTDVAIAMTNGIEIIYGGLSNRVTLPLAGLRVRGLTLLDYDNDGWLDLCASGSGLRVWRNVGASGFRDVTTALGLDKLLKGDVESVATADFDNDCDTDLMVGVKGQGLQLFRNDGGNANRQIKLTLIGNRSNASGIGIRVELAAGQWRTLRTVNSLPVEIGVGKNSQLDSVTGRWFDLSLSSTDVKVDCQSPVPLIELTLPTGSCPYLYAWDGKRFRFVTDLLGASPLGLPVAERRFIDADPDELVRIGDETSFAPQGGSYVLQVTEELREVLYLDAAQLLVVDHPAGTEVFTTGKLLPGKPFPKPEIVTLRHPHPLHQAVRSDGSDVTTELNQTDNRLVSPVALRIPQLRGLAEPWSITLDFGSLPAERPLVLALTGWLRFGGGMANIAASQDPDLPFPFPALEVEGANGEWRPVDVTVGAPCGRTKSMIVDLTGRLPAGSRRLRLTTAFEIHWDRIALLEKEATDGTSTSFIPPDVADLHWRGFSEHEDLPPGRSLTPDYDRTRANPRWRITPTGWCTRYGDVRELVDSRDNALTLLNGGDELTLKFTTDRLPPKPAGTVRTFFLSTSGWDKDADFHCELGYQVEPLPWHGMDYQLYGRQARPKSGGDWWISKYNTRWVGPLTLNRDGTAFGTSSRRE